MSEKSTELIDNINKLRIAVIGDFILDVYIKGDVNRISPEAPVPVLNKKVVEKSCGGAGNVWNNLMSMGVDAYLFTSGDDNVIQYDSRVFKHKSITPIKTRIMSGNHHLMRIDEEPGSPEYTTYDDLFWKKDIETLLPSLDAVIFSDYHKGAIDPTTSHTIISMCNEKGIPVFVDAKKHFDKYKNTMCVKCNSHEADGIDIQALRADMNIRHFIVTKGHRGINAYSYESILCVEGKEVDIVDVCGAGDVVIAVAAVAFCAGNNMVKSIEISNNAAAESCRHPGVYAITKNDLIELYKK